MESSALFDQRVYAQDTEPPDERNGNIWVNTSTDNNQVLVYSTNTGNWEPVSEGTPIFVTQEALTFQETDLDLSNTKTGVDNGSVTLVKESPTTRPSDNNSTEGTDDDDGIVINPNRELYGITGELTPGTTEVVVELRNTSNNSVIASSNGNRNFSIEPPNPLQPDTEYTLAALIGGTDSLGEKDTNVSYPYTGGALDIVAGWDGFVDDKSSSTISAINNVGPIYPPDNGSATIGFSPIPKDLVVWDRFSWQYDEKEGSLSVDIETNDGTGWNTYSTNVIPPVSISEVPTNNNVRIVVTYNKTKDENPPVISYAVRRGER